MSGNQPSSNRRGRPRDKTIDGRVVAAARDLLAEVGYGATTIQAISGRAGVPVSAIYRRWPSRVELIEDVVVPRVPRFAPWSGDLRRDLIRFERAFRKVFTTPQARTAVPALLAGYQAGERGRPPEGWLRDSWRPPFRDLLQASTPHQVDPAVDADALFDLLLGSILVQAFVPTASLRPRTATETVDLLCRTVAPR